MYNLDKALGLARNDLGHTYLSSAGAVVFTSTCTTDAAIWQYPKRRKRGDQRDREIRDSYQQKFGVMLNGNSSCHYRKEIKAIVADEFGADTRTVERAVRATSLSNAVEPSNWRLRINELKASCLDGTRQPWGLH
jgi:hypothetical protein